MLLLLANNDCCTLLVNDKHYRPGSPEWNNRVLQELVNSLDSLEDSAQPTELVLKAVHDRLMQIDKPMIFQGAIYKIRDLIIKYRLQKLHTELSIRELCTEMLRQELSKMLSEDCQRRLGMHGAYFDPNSQ